MSALSRTLISHLVSLSSHVLLIRSCRSYYVFQRIYLKQDAGVTRGPHRGISTTVCYEITTQRLAHWYRCGDPSSTPVQFMRDFWWTMWHGNRFLSEVFGFAPSVSIRLSSIYSVFHNECTNFKTLYFCNHEPQMNETYTTWTAVA